MFPRYKVEPEIFSAGAGYSAEHAKRIRRMFHIPARFDEVDLFWEETPDRIWIPRNCYLGKPKKAFDQRDIGSSISLSSTFESRNPEQDRLVEESVDLLNHQQSFITQAPTGFGKTVIGAEIIKRYGRRALVIITKADLRKQWFTTFKKILGLQPNKVGLIQGNTFNVAGKPIVVAMVQSLAKFERYPPWVYQDFGLVVVDECVAGDSRISLLNGGAVSIRQLHTMFLEGQRPGVVTYNREMETFEWGQLENVIAKGAKECIQSVFDGGQELKTTPEHEFLTTGGWVEAQHLTGQHRVLHFGGMPVQLVAQEEVGFEDVYDLTIPDTHNFVANGLVVHNCHRMGADFFSQSMWRSSGLVRMGLSATPRRKDGKEFVFKAHIGPVRVKTEAITLIPKVLIRKYFTKKLVHVYTGLGRTQKANKVLSHDTEYNKLITSFVSKAYQKKRCVVIMSEFRDHLNTLELMLRARGVKKQDIGYYVGGMSDKEADIGAGKPIVLATYQYTSEGTDYPWWDTLVMATPRSDVEQIIGRMLREYDGKPTPVILDLEAGPNKHYRMYAQNRRRMYTQKNWPVTVVEN